MCFKYVSRKIFITNFISILQLLWLGLFSSLRKLDLCRHPEVFLEKGVLKICMKSTGEHPCRSVISIMLQSNFIEITLRHGCSPVNLLHIFRTPFTKNTSGRLLHAYIFDIMNYLSLFRVSMFA